MRTTLPVSVVDQTETQGETGDQKSDWPHERLLVILTVVLAVTGIYQALLSRTTAQRQMRAYVGPLNHTTHFSVDWTEEKGTVSLTVRNFGQTPASEFSVMSSLVINRRDYDPEAIPNKVGGSRGVLSPGDGAMVRLDMEHTLTADQWVMIEADACRLYLVLTIYYVDIFGREQVTRACTYMDTRPIGTRRTRGAISHSKGNEAT